MESHVTHTHLLFAAAGLFWIWKLAAADGHILDQSRNLLTVVGMKEEEFRVSVPSTAPKACWGQGWLMPVISLLGVWGGGGVGGRGEIGPVQSSLNHRVKLSK